MRTISHTAILSKAVAFIENGELIVSGLGSFGKAKDIKGFEENTSRIPIAFPKSLFKEVSEGKVPSGLGMRKIGSYFVIGELSKSQDPNYLWFSGVDFNRYAILKPANIDIKADDLQEIFEEISFPTENTERILKAVNSKTVETSITLSVMCVLVDHFLYKIFDLRMASYCAEKELLSIDVVETSVVSETTRPVCLKAV